MQIKTIIALSVAGVLIVSNGIINGYNVKLNSNLKKELKSALARGEYLADRLDENDIELTEFDKNALRVL